MRVLVTGIEGFVGTHLAEYLLGLQDVEVHGTMLGSAPPATLQQLMPGLRVQQADILDSSRIEEVFHDLRPDRVVHLAGQAFVPTAVQDPAGTIRTNVMGTLSILEALRKLAERDRSRPAAVIVSSGEIYGNVPPQRQPITEEQAPAPGNPYASSKASLDLLTQSYRRTYGLEVIVARPFNHAGPRQSPTFVCSEFGRRFAEFALQQKPPVLKVGDVESRRDFTDVRDVVRAYWMLFERSGEEHVFNVCSGMAHSIREVIAVYSEISGITPDVVIDAAKVRPYGSPVLVGSNQRLRRATGWIPEIPLRTTLQDVFRYWQGEITRPE
jgi:GDP-4-dehydro-6-deoxy-D-mannose reductase